MPQDNINKNSQSSELDSDINAAYSSTTDINGGQSIILAQSHTEISTGPLPHPELLKGYNEIISDGAERIMKMAEKEQQHRFENDDAKINCAKSEIKLIERGQIMAFILCIIFIGSGITMACVGYSAICYVLIALGMAPAIGLFYNNSAHRK